MGNGWLILLKCLRICFALQDNSSAKSYDIAAKKLPSSQSLVDVLSKLKQLEPDGMRIFLIAELLFRNAFAAMESLEYYEKAVALEPENEFYRKSIFNKYRYLGMDNLSIRHAKKLKTYKKRLELPLKVAFNPARPDFHMGKPTKVGEAVVYDHSKFTVELKNQHLLPMHMKSVVFYSLGNKQESGLGDVINYWPWKGRKIIKSGKSISFNKVWGFTVDTPNTEMTYQFKFTYSIGDDPKEYVYTKDLLLYPVE